MMFCRHPRLPIDSELMQGEAEGGDQVLESEDHKAFMEEILQIQDETKVQACKKIEEAQQKQKEYYDNRHLPEVTTEAWLVCTLAACILYCRLLSQIFLKGDPTRN